MEEVREDAAKIGSCQVLKEIWILIVGLFQ